VADPDSRQYTVPANTSDWETVNNYPCDAEGRRSTSNAAPVHANWRCTGQRGSSTGRRYGPSKKHHSTNETVAVLRPADLPMTKSKIVFAALLTALAIWLSQCGIRLGNFVELPKGFIGWVVIRYGIPGAPALSRYGIRELIRVPPDGEVKTSSTRKVGYGSDRYVYRNEDALVNIGLAREGCSDQEVCIRDLDYVTGPMQVTRFFVGKASDVPRFQMPEVP
jgi:hypothetical protein